MHTDDSAMLTDSSHPLRIVDRITNGELVLRARNTRSKCWSIFAIIEDRNGVEVKGYVFCRMCKKVFIFNRSTSTSNLLKHGCLKQANKPKSPNSIIEENSHRNLENEDVEESGNKLTKLITKWLIKYCRPYGLIQDNGLKTVFEEFVQFGAKFGTSVDIEKLLPSSTAFASDTNEMYDQCLKRVQAEIASIRDNGFGLATDSCTDIVSKKTYITLTMHFLKNGELKFRLLGLRSMEGEKFTIGLETNQPKSIASKIAKDELILRGNPNYSRCWDVFAKIEDNHGNQVNGFVHCRICKKVLIYKPPSHGNLVRHKCYIDKFKPQSPATSTEVQTLSLETPSKDLEIETVENRSNKLTKLISKWSIKDCRSYDMIQFASLKSVFEEFVLLGAKFGTTVEVDKLLPNSTAVARNVSEIYEQCFKTVKTDIALIKDNGFGLVVDVFRDNLARNSYIAVTIHFLKNGALTFRLLGLKLMEGDNSTSQDIREAVETILNDFDCKLSSKSIIVTNGANDFNEAFVKYEHLSCISHLLNNVLRKSIEEVPEVEELVRTCDKLVNFLKNSPLKASLNSPLQSFCPSRWNTLYNMLISLENNWNEITYTLQQHNEQQRIEAINLIHLKAVNKTLQPFEEAIETLEEENSSTLHLVLVYLHELKKSCDTNDSEFKDFDFIESLKEKLRFYLEEIGTNNDTTLYKIALFLYPPTNKLLQFSDTEKQYIEEECIRLMKCYENELQPKIKQECAELSTPVCKRKKFFSDFVEPETSHDPNELIKQELQCYKCLRVVNSDEFDVFSWWEQQKDNFPLLYKLSCAVLATPASSSSAQRIFSAAGSLLCENMFDLGHGETNVEQIMFINSNSEQDDFESEFDLK